MKPIIAVCILSIALLLTITLQPCLAQGTRPATSTLVTSTSAGATYTLTVVISNVSKRSGELRVGIANSDETFTGESYKTKVVTVPASGDISVTFDSLVAGRYAVRLFQDLNANQKMDFNGQMPAEPFGFSNVTMLMGPPSFGQCAFDLAETKQIQVSLMEM